MKALWTKDLREHGWAVGATWLGCLGLTFLVVVFAQNRGLTSSPLGVTGWVTPWLGPLVSLLAFGRLFYRELAEGTARWVRVLPMSGATWVGHKLLFGLVWVQGSLQGVLWGYAALSPVQTSFDLMAVDALKLALYGIFSVLLGVVWSWLGRFRGLLLIFLVLFLLVIAAIGSSSFRYMGPWVLLDPALHGSFDLSVAEWGAVLAWGVPVAAAAALLVGRGPERWVSTGELSANERIVLVLAFVAGFAALGAVVPVPLPPPAPQELSLSRRVGQVFVGVHAEGQAQAMVPILDRFERAWRALPEPTQPVEIFIDHGPDLEPGKVERGAGSTPERVFVRFDAGVDPSWHPEVAEQLLRWAAWSATRGRTDHESLRWMEDGIGWFLLWVSAEQQEARVLMEGLSSCAARAGEVTETVLRQWARFRFQHSDFVARAVAFQLLAQAAERAGELAVRSRLSQVLARSFPQNGLALLRTPRPEDLLGPEPVVLQPGRAAASVGLQLRAEVDDDGSFYPVPHWGPSSGRLGAVRVELWEWEFGPAPERDPKRLAEWVFPSASAVDPDVLRASRFPTGTHLRYRIQRGLRSSVAAGPWCPESTGWRRLKLP